MSGRRSDIGFADDPKGAEDNEPELYAKYRKRNAFMNYHAQSCDNFKAYAEQAGLDAQASQICCDALERMYMQPKTERSRPYARALKIRRSCRS